MILEKDENGFLISKCCECIFAICEQDQPWHKKQTGCRFDRPLKFQERGTPVEFKEGDSVDAYEIHTFCNNMRDKSWLDSQEAHSLDFAEGQVNEDNEIQYVAVIYSKNNECADDVKKSLNSILSQSILPKKIVIGIYNKELDYPKLITEVRSDYESEVPLLFSRVLDDRYERYVIDHCLIDMKYQGYLAVLAGTELKEGSIRNLNNLINVDCKMVSIAKNSDSSLLYVSKLLHDELGGNAEGVLENEEVGEKVSYSRIEDKLVAISEEYYKTIVEL